jgi:hypothetical protein
MYLKKNEKLVTTSVLDMVKQRRRESKLNAILEYRQDV